MFLEGAELALHEAKERKRLRIEAENKAKEMEEAAMEDMMMGIEDYESESEEEDSAKEGNDTSPLFSDCLGGNYESSNRLSWLAGQLNCAELSRSVWVSSLQFVIRCSSRQSQKSSGMNTER